jgi:hypothetical protein
VTSVTAGDSAASEAADAASGVHAATTQAGITAASAAGRTVCKEEGQLSSNKRNAGAATQLARMVNTWFTHRFTHGLHIFYAWSMESLLSVMQGLSKVYERFTQGLRKEYASYAILHKVYSWFTKDLHKVYVCLCIVYARFTQIILYFTQIYLRFTHDLCKLYACLLIVNTSVAFQILEHGLAHWITTSTCVCHMIQCHTGWCCLYTSNCMHVKRCQFYGISTCFHLLCRCF